MPFRSEGEMRRLNPERYDTACSTEPAARSAFATGNGTTARRHGGTAARSCGGLNAARHGHSDTVPPIAARRRALARSAHLGPAHRFRPATIKTSNHRPGRPRRWPPAHSAKDGNDAPATLPQPPKRTAHTPKK